jgi:hypothetical protein
MPFDLESSRQILQRTPSTLEGLVRDLPEGWVRHNEEPGTWRRAQNLDELAALRLASEQFELEGRHPELGSVTLGQLLSTWVVHDLDHLVQVGRVMAKCYMEEVGPWRRYPGVLS